METLNKILKSKANCVLIITIALIFCNSEMVEAQVGSSLQFNQVRLLTATTDNIGAQWTVPSGCVWKIESFGTGNAGQSPMTIYLNSKVAFSYLSKYYTSSYSSPRYKYNDYSGVLWLPENTNIGTVAPSSSAFRWLSVVEFKVVQ